MENSRNKMVEVRIETTFGKLLLAEFNDYDEAKKFTKILEGHTRYFIEIIEG